ncbi:MAG: zinc ribbon domain-containing protein [Chloroflexi bacterium]|nr:zinc ribbon domain-containing protein [Chloroflexota bacterium]
MPIYEYRCRACRKRSSVFVRSMSTAVQARCEHCDSTKLNRLVSRVVAPRSGGDSLDSFDESMLADVDENDPRSVARFARRMRDEMGEELGPDFDQAIEQMEAGEMPDEDSMDMGGDYDADL